MKRFHFTLEAVRTLRLRQEHNAQEAYAQTLAARLQALNRLEKAQEELNASSQELREQLAKGCRASEAAQAYDYQRSLVQRRDECSNVLNQAERRVNAALQVMLNARRQRELVDKFYDKQHLRHQRDQSRAEQKVMDDFAVRRNGSSLVWTPTEIPS